MKREIAPGVFVVYGDNMGDDFDEIAGVDRSQITSTATVVHTGDANVVFTFSCGHTVKDVIRDRHHRRDPEGADHLVDFVNGSIALDCSVCTPEVPYNGPQVNLGPFSDEE